MPIALPKTISLPRLQTRGNWLFLLIFLYFFTTSADLLNIPVFIFTGKLNHIIALFLFGIIIISRQRLVFEKKIFFAFIGTICSMIFSMFFSMVVSRSLGYLFVHIFTFCVYFIIPYNLVLLYGRRTIFDIYRASFIAVGVIGAIQFFLSFFGIIAPFVGQFVVGKISRAQAFTYEPSYYALYMALFVMYYNALYLFDSEKLFVFKKLINLVCVNLLLLVSTSTGAFFAYFIFLIVCFCSQIKKWVRECDRKIMRKLISLSGIFGVVFVAIFFVAKDIFMDSFWKFFRVGFLAHHSFRERWEGIESAWRVFIDHPWFGVGVGGVGPLLYEQYFFSNREVELYQSSFRMFDLFDPTNVFTELLASLGITGLTAFVVFFVFYFRVFNKTAMLEFLPIKEKGVIYAFLVSIIVMLITLQFNQNMFRSYMWVHLAFCLSYVISLREEYAKP